MSGHVRIQLPPRGDLRDLSTDAWKAVDEWRSEKDAARFLARFGTTIVRLDMIEGALETMTLDHKRMLNVLAKAIEWGTEDDKGGWHPNFPPPEIAANLLAERTPPLPVLERVVEVPILGADGEVHDTPGYDTATRTFLAPAVEVEAVPRRPTRKHIGEAVGLLRDLTADFPFAGPDDGLYERSHGYAMLLTPFMRAMVDGRTPLHVFNAPTRGTGKSLLAKVLAIPALGRRELPAMAEGRDGDEWRKRITSVLRSAPVFVLIDNVQQPLVSSALAMALTTGRYTDRLLGQSQTIVLPVRCCWVVTGNNITMSSELTRRAVRTHLDSGLEFPEDRPHGEFAHPYLERWARENRGKLVWAALTLGRGWVVAGCPGPNPANELGGFEEWTHTIGGVIEWSGLGAILGNVHELRAVNVDTGPADFLAAAWERTGGGEFSANAVIGQGQEHLGLADGTDRELAHRLGLRMREFVDHPMGGYVLRRSGTTHGSNRWQVERLGDGDE